MSKPIELLEAICSVPGSDEPLVFAPDGSATRPDGHCYRAVDGIPILRDERAPVEFETEDDGADPLGPDRAEALRKIDGYTLVVGPGSPSIRSDRVIEVNFHARPHTDIVSDAHWLPFHSNTFDAVVAMNVFQHLWDPRAAAREALRVLKPGGQILAHTAFLQPLQDAPEHYYNATEWGLRRWFDGFRDVQVAVTPNFNPLYSLSWIAATLLHNAEATVGPETRDAMADLTLGDLADFWDSPGSLDAGIIERFWSLPEPAQRAIAAGFEMTARKPG